MFNNSPALYKNICSTRVQIAGDLFIRVNAEVMILWSLKLCWIVIFSHFILTIKVNFDRIQFDVYCIYRPNCFFVVKKVHIVHFETIPGFIDTPLR